jgi:maltooligosyltrehalose trehalohydrolase
LQNHDQVGNRAKGERSSHLLSRGKLKIAAAVVLSAPFIPMLFQGEEWAANSPFLYFTNHEDAELGRLVTEGRRREFAAFSAHSDDVPDPQALATFERSRLVWDECSRAPHAEILDWHRRVIRLRREYAALSDGRLDRVEVTFDEQAKWLVMARGPISVACNLSERRQQTPLRIGKDARILLSSEKETQLVGDGVELPPESVAVVDTIGNRGSAVR